MWMGIDGCRGGWVIASMPADSSRVVDIEIEVAPRLEAPLLNGELSVALIDMPVGLLSERSRQIETLARRALPGQASTVFNVPVADAVYASSYPEASALNARHTGKKLSKQAWYLCPKIRELNELLAAQPSLASKVFESHPEIVYRQWVGQRLPKKKTAEGERARVEFLRSVGVPVDRLVRDVGTRYPKRMVLIDDVLDALVLLLLATRPSRDLDPAPQIALTGCPINLRVPDPS